MEQGEGLSKPAAELMMSHAALATQVNSLSGQLVWKLTASSLGVLGSGGVEMSGLRHIPNSAFPLVLLCLESLVHFICQGPNMTNEGRNNIKVLHHLFN